MKKIGIDAQFLGSRDRGLGRYTENLIKNLKSIDPPKGETSPQYIIFLGKESKGWRRQILFPFVLKKRKLNLVHFTHFNVPIFYRGKFVVTIHDLNFSYVSFLKKIAYKIILKSALKRAEKIIAVSNYTKNEILKKHRVNPNKIKVIYEGIF